MVFLGIFFIRRKLRKFISRMIFLFIPGNNGYFSINYFKMCWQKNGISLVKTKVIDKRVKVNHWPPYKLRYSNSTTQTRILTITKRLFRLFENSRMIYPQRILSKWNNQMERIVTSYDLFLKLFEILWLFLLFYCRWYFWSR